ncbi:MAG TPA: TPM domain-containing protein [Herpetosiphonaceae bacterium]
MRRVQIWSVLVGLWLLLILPALAQAPGVQIEDPDTVLGSQESVRRAAQRLADEGARVIVVAAGPSAGQTPSQAEQFLDALLARRNIAPNSGQLQPNDILLYVARDARWTLLLYGQRWKDNLDPVFQSIQVEQMNPRFASGDLAGGLVAGLDAVRTTINPPVPTVVYLLGGALVLTVIGVVAVPLLKKRRVSADALAAARERMQQARKTAGAAIADLDRLVEQAQAKAEYDRISYSQGNIERLQSLQAKGIQLFHEAQDAFAAGDDQQEAKAVLAIADYDAISAHYARAQEIARQASAAIGEAESLRAQFDAQGTPNTGPTTRLRE